jgi:hypothetical protein
MSGSAYDARDGWPGTGDVLLAVPPDSLMEGRISLQDLRKTAADRVVEALLHVAGGDRSGH